MWTTDALGNNNRGNYDEESGPVQSGLGLQAAANELNGIDHAPNPHDRIGKNYNCGL